MFELRERCSGRTVHGTVAVEHLAHGCLTFRSPYEVSFKQSAHRIAHCTKRYTHARTHAHTRHASETFRTSRWRYAVATSVQCWAVTRQTCQITWTISAWLDVSLRQCVLFTDYQVFSRVRNVRNCSEINASRSRTRLACRGRPHLLRVRKWVVVWWVSAAERSKGSSVIWSTA